MAKAILLSHQSDLSEDFAKYLNEIRKRKTFPSTGVQFGMSENIFEMTDEEYDAYLIREAAKYNTEFSSWMDEDTFEDNVTIYYYPDLNDRYNVKKFKSLFEFDDFLQAEGVHVPDEQVQLISCRSESHCAIDPYMKRYMGTLNLISDSSYGGLLWTCNGYEDDEW